MRIRWLLRGQWRGPTDAETERWQSKRRQIRNLKRLLDREKPDIVHVKGRLIAEAWIVLPPERTIFHVATAGQCDDSWDDAEVAAFRQFIERCACVFAPGSGVAERFKREFGISREVVPVFTMAPGAQDHRPETLDHRPVEGPVLRAAFPQSNVQGLGSKVFSVVRFGFVGRLAEGKGILETVEALALLKREGVEPPFVFVGDGPLAGALREAVARHDLRNVAMTGVLTPEQAVTRMDVLVLASESEAMPLVLVEALSAGHPCVATAVGGIQDLIRAGMEGFVIEDGTPAAIADGIRRMSAMSAEAFGAMSARARARYEECCTPDRVGAVVERRYRKMIERRTSNAEHRTPNIER